MDCVTAPTAWKRYIASAPMPFFLNNVLYSVRVSFLQWYTRVLQAIYENVPYALEILKATF